MEKNSQAMSSILLDIVFSEIQRAMADLNMPFRLIQNEGAYRSLSAKYFLSHVDSLDLLLLVGEELVEINMIAPAQSMIGDSFDRVLIAGLLTDFLVDCTLIYEENKKEFLLRIGFIPELDRLADQIQECAERVIESFVTLARVFEHFEKNGGNVYEAIGRITEGEE